jgi:hypothetical protein
MMNVVDGVTVKVIVAPLGAIPASVRSATSMLEAFTVDVTLPPPPEQSCTDGSQEMTLECPVTGDDDGTVGDDDVALHATTQSATQTTTTAVNEARISNVLSSLTRMTAQVEAHD